jgi:hypothetical protein
MHKNLLIIGGIWNIFGFVFHAMFWKLFDWPESLLCLSHDNRAGMQVIEIQLMLVFLFFAYISLFHTSTMLNNSIGRGLAWFIVIFNLVRLINQFLFWNPLLPQSITIVILCLISMSIYIIPLILSKNFVNESLSSK